MSNCLINTKQAIVSPLIEIATTSSSFNELVFINGAHSLSFKSMDRIRCDSDSMFVGMFDISISRDKLRFVSKPSVPTSRTMASKWAEKLLCGNGWYAVRLAYVLRVIYESETIGRWTESGQRLQCEPFYYWLFDGEVEIRAAHSIITVSFCRRNMMSTNDLQFLVWCRACVRVDTSAHRSFAQF